MKSFWITTAVVGATLALSACPSQTPPIPGLQTRPGSSNPHDNNGAQQHAVTGISWFQGTLEEAFAHHAGCPSARLLHY
jgi:hypothetical protein